MTNTESSAELTLGPCHAEPGAVRVLSAREVPLGGPRAMTVRRTLPHRDRSFVGAWCFVDHYGPDDVAATGGMRVPPHPHTGLQTISWLFDGEVEHRDSAGVHAIVRPGEVNLMTAGQGIAHSEVSTDRSRALHGVQLWVVLPREWRDAPRDFQCHRAEVTALAAGVSGRILIGELAGHRSPIRTFTPLLGAELLLDAGTTWTLPVDPDHEHGLLLDSGSAQLCGARLAPGDLGIVEPGGQVTISAHSACRAILLGGAPFEEEVVMWWNFIAGTHDEIAAARQSWQERSERFGEVPGHGGERLDAPALPTVRLKPRGRIGRRAGS